MYMIIYDTLEKMFQKYLEKKKKKSWNILCFKESVGSSNVWYLWKCKDLWKLRNDVSVRFI